MGHNMTTENASFSILPEHKDELARIIVESARMGSPKYCQMHWPHTDENGTRIIFDFDGGGLIASPLDLLILSACIAKTLQSVFIHEAADFQVHCDIKRSRTNVFTNAANLHVFVGGLGADLQTRHKIYIAVCMHLLKCLSNNDTAELAVVHPSPSDKPHNRYSKIYFKLNRTEHFEMSNGEYIERNQEPLEMEKKALLNILSECDTLFGQMFTNVDQSGSPEMEFFKWFDPLPTARIQIRPPFCFKMKAKKKSTAATAALSQSQVLSQLDAEVESMYVPAWTLFFREDGTMDISVFNFTLQKNQSQMMTRAFLDRYILDTPPEAKVELPPFNTLIIFPQFSSKNTKTSIDDLMVKIFRQHIKNRQNQRNALVNVGRSGDGESGFPNFPLTATALKAMIQRRDSARGSCRSVKRMRFDEEEGGAADEEPVHMDPPTPWMWGWMLKCTFIRLSKTDPTLLTLESIVKSTKSTHYEQDNIYYDDFFVEDAVLLVAERKDGLRRLELQLACHLNVPCPLSIPRAKIAHKKLNHVMMLKVTWCQKNLKLVICCTDKDCVKHNAGNGLDLSLEQQNSIAGFTEVFKQVSEYLAQSVSTQMALEEQEANRKVGQCLQETYKADLVKELKALGYITPQDFRTTNAHFIHSLCS